MDTLKNEVKTSKNAAFIFGIISILLAVGSSQVFERFIHCNANKSWVGWIFLYFLGIAVIGILGLIMSIKGLKSGNKITGAAGIILNLFGIALAVFLGYLAELTIFVCTT